MDKYALLGAVNQVRHLLSGLNDVELHAAYQVLATEAADSVVASTETEPLWGLVEAIAAEKRRREWEANQ